MELLLSFRTATRACFSMDFLGFPLPVVTGKHFPELLINSDKAGQVVFLQALTVSQRAQVCQWSVPSARCLVLKRLLKSVCASFATLVLIQQGLRAKAQEHRSVAGGGHVLDQFCCLN